MALFSAAEKNYVSIVAPLKTIVESLSSYIEEQKIKISSLNKRKIDIEDDISLSEIEIEKSEFTTEKISDMMPSVLNKKDDSDIKK